LSPLRLHVPQASDRGSLPLGGSIVAWLRDSRLAREERGSTLIELAFSLSVLLMLIFGIMDFSRALYINHFLANAAREATRYAMVRGGDWPTSCATTLSGGCTASSANITAYVKLISPAGVDPSLLNVATTWPGTDATGASCGGSNILSCVVDVKVTYTFSFILPFLPTNSLLFTSTSKMTIAQ
jgi:Flp pilus assembly protein TadG